MLNKLVGGTKLPKHVEMEVVNEHKMVGTKKRKLFLENQNARETNKKAALFGGQKSHIVQNFGEFGTNFHTPNGNHPFNFNFHQNPIGIMTYRRRRKRWNYYSNGKPLPTHFDARKAWPECANVIGTISDQGNCGSCWAVSIASVLSDRFCIARLKLLDREMKIWESLVDKNRSASLSLNSLFSNLQYHQLICF